MRTGDTAPGEVRLLSVTPLTWEAGLESVLVALDATRRRGHRLRYDLVGRGPLAPMVEFTIADLDLGEIVRLWPPGDARWDGADGYLHAPAAPLAGTGVEEARRRGLPVVGPAARPWDPGSLVAELTAWLATAPGRG